MILLCVVGHFFSKKWVKFQSKFSNGRHDTMRLSELRESYLKLDEQTRLKIDKERDASMKSLMAIAMQPIQPTALESFYTMVMQPIQPTAIESFVTESLRHYEERIRKVVLTKKIIEEAKAHGIKLMQSLNALNFENIFIAIKPLIAQLTLFKTVSHFFDLNFITQNLLKTTTYKNTLTLRP